VAGSPVTLVRAGGVATVTVDNPPANALSEPTLEGLLDAAGRIAADPEVRSVVFTGTGERAFMAGADLREFAEILGDRERMEHHVGLTRPVFGAWWELEVPVVAAVNAHAMGGGLEFALLCDLIVAEPGARFGLPEVTLGLMPGAGGTQRLPRRIGLGAARELALLGTVVDAQRAAALGLVDRVAEKGRALAEAQELAAKLASRPAEAVRAVKRALRAAGDLPLSEGLDVERGLFLDVTMTADAREGVEAFLGRREPRFAHR
jgi:enoyl-CoA hydratase/carnithine racemase